MPSSRSRRSRALLTAAPLALALLAACGGPAALPTPTASPAGPSVYAGWPPAASYELIPIPVSSEIVVGPNRLLVNVLDNANEPASSPDTQATLRFYDLAADPAQPKFEQQASYMETVEGLPGLYRAQVGFDRAGDWGLETVLTDAAGTRRTGRMVFSVRETGTTPAIGAQAPASETQTATTDEEIAAISTDREPDPDFYRTSVADALAQNEPFAVAFATPAFCRSATCGPTLDVLKAVAAYYKDRVTFIHVEPYELEMSDGQLQPVLTDQNLPISVPATNEWGLPTEPYVFVVDRDGKVAAKFEGIVAADELEAALAAVSE